MLSKQIKVASLNFDIPVTLERMMENALDWEHLAFQHSSSFYDLKLLDKDNLSWLAEATLNLPFKPKQIVHLIANLKDSSWVTTIQAGFSKGLVVKSKAVAIDDKNIHVKVDCYIPTSQFYLLPLKRLLSNTYKQLYLEDIAMMVERQKQLQFKEKASQNKTNQGDIEHLIGNRESFNNGSFCFTFGNSRFKVIDNGNELTIYSVTCPHRLGPLQDSEIKNGQITCPWHGYQFDIITRDCNSNGLKLASPPELQWRGDELWAIGCAD